MWASRPAASAVTTATCCSRHASQRNFTTTNPVHSMIGRRLLKYPHEVTISTTPLPPTPQFPRYTSQITVTGPRGTLNMPIPPYIKLTSPPLAPNAPKKILTVSVVNPQEKKQKQMWGTTRAILENMVEGVIEGYTIPIRFEGVGYRALFENSQLSLKLGYSHPILMDIPQGVEVKIPAPTRIILQGNCKETVTQFAARIRKWRPPEPYNQKGIFVGDETIKKKEGKKR
ncbi:ribosomal protein L6, alpha-beta domain-containing protein [Gaertneriomyces semiglobifer]|nr:ribosomal protein L6, alpha-beta domain-containing protein [Gaertneriomyces semiglobifer]